MDKNKDNDNIDISKIEHRNDDQDTISDDTSGFIQNMIGDSGGPYWTYDTMLGNEIRAIVVAIHNDAFDDSSFSLNKHTQCRMSATKITKDILVWIKHISGMPSYIQHILNR